MDTFNQDYPALGHAGEGVAGIDGLCRRGLFCIIRGEIKLSELWRENGREDRFARPLNKIPLIPVEEIERSGLPSRQFVF